MLATEPAPGWSTNLHSEEARLKARTANTGKRRSPEIRAKFSRIQREIADRAMADKGYRISLEQRESIAQKLRGRKQSAESNAKRVAWAQANKYKCHPGQDHCNRLSELYSGKPFSGVTFDHTGRVQSDEERAARKVTAKRGSDHHNWKDGKAIERRKQRLIPEYLRFRRAVLRRDNYRCQSDGCGCVDRSLLTVHHIKPWHSHPDLRHEVSNGITYCKPCHAKRDPSYRWVVRKLEGSTCSG